MHRNKNAAIGQLAWQQFLKSSPTTQPIRFDSHSVGGADVAEAVDEIKNISTNSTGQWCLNAIELLEFVPEQIPENPGGGLH
jgi:hypothetical protein